MGTREDQVRIDPPHGKFGLDGNFGFFIINISSNSACALIGRNIFYKNEYFD
jgi:hypothetical protein